jgi:hypothetical protein
VSVSELKRMKELEAENGFGHGQPADLQERTFFVGPIHHRGHGDAAI